jgi:hypothetical protein
MITYLLLIYVGVQAGSGIHGEIVARFEDPNMQFGALYMTNDLCGLGYTNADFEALEKSLGAYDQERILLGAYAIKVEWLRWTDTQRHSFCDKVKAIGSD